MKNGFDETKRLLSIVAEFVSRSSEEDLRALLSGTARLAIVERMTSKSVKKSPPRSTLTNVDLLELLRSLSSLESREAGLKLLQERVPTRKALEALAREMDMPVRKDENVERMRDRVVDQIIGSKLNSRAIRGNSTTIERAEEIDNSEN